MSDACSVDCRFEFPLDIIWIAKLKKKKNNYVQQVERLLKPEKGWPLIFCEEYKTIGCASATGFLRDRCEGFTTSFPFHLSTARHRFMFCFNRLSYLTPGGSWQNH